MPWWAHAFGYHPQNHGSVWHLKVAREVVPVGDWDARDGQVEGWCVAWLRTCLAVTPCCRPLTIMQAASPVCASANSSRSAALEPQPWKSRLHPERHCVHHRPN
jgi:hypothetical protein